MIKRKFVFVVGLGFYFSLFLYGVATERKDPSMESILIALAAAENPVERASMRELVIQEIHSSPDRKLEEDLLFPLIELYESEEDSGVKADYLGIIHEIRSEKSMPIYEAAIGEEDPWLAFLGIAGISTLDRERGMRLSIDYWKENRATLVGNHALRLIESELRSMIPELFREIKKHDLAIDEEIALIREYLDAGLIYSTENVVRRNLKEIYAAAMAWRLQTGRSEITYEKLIDEGYLSRPDPIAGETYDQISISWREQPVKLEATTEAGKVVTFAPYQKRTRARTESVD